MTGRVSCWKSGQTHADRPEFHSPIPSSVEVCVIGGGIAGVSTAYALSRQGHDVCLLESGQIGQGETSRSSAHVSYIPEDRVSDLIRLHGRDNTEAFVRAHHSAIDTIEGWVRDEGIGCELMRVPGYVVFTEPGQGELFSREVEASRSVGLTQFESQRNTEILGGFFPSLRFPNQAQFNPYQYVLGLASAASRRGARICCGQQVVDIKEGIPNRVILRDGRSLHAEQIVVATNTPFHSIVGLHTKQYSTRTYIVAFSVIRDQIERALYNDSQSPSHYARLTDHPFDGSSELLLVGGEDHKVGQDDFPNHRFEKLAAWAQSSFKHIKRTEYQWSGEIRETVDRFGFIGRMPKSSTVFVASGDCGVGLTNGTLAALILPNLIRQETNVWEKIFDPARVSLSGVSTYLKENLNTVWQYSDYLTPGTTDIASIPAGTGAVVQRGLKKIACFKTNSGVLIERSAICTHLGGVVHWNAAEKSWDCPCHGSRFDVDGEVLDGPAARPLAEVDSEEEQGVEISARPA